MYRKKLALWKKGTGNWHKDSEDNIDAFQSVYFEKEFLFAWQYAVDSKRESRDINKDERYIMY